MAEWREKKVARDGINTCWFKKDERERERGRKDLNGNNQNTHSTMGREWRGGSFCDTLGTHDV